MLKIKKHLHTATKKVAVYSTVSFGLISQTIQQHTVFIDERGILRK